MNYFKRSLFVLAMMMIIFIVTGCPSPASSSATGGDIQVTGVSFDSDVVTVKAGDTLQLPCTVSPSDATDKSVTWTISDESIATVSEQGLITAKRVGNATISVTSKDGEYNASCELKVSTPFLVLFKSTTELSVNLGGREGADKKLKEMAPENISNVHAFISVNPEDEIRDMPVNYGYPEDVPVMSLNSEGEVFLLADNWADLLDGEIKICLWDAFKRGRYWYSGSKSNGEVDLTADGWTNSESKATEGTFGINNSYWLCDYSSNTDGNFLGIGAADFNLGYNSSNKIKIIFDKNGATGVAPDDISHVPGQYITLPGPQKMKYENRALTGWNTVKDGSGTEYGIYPVIIDNKSDITLYAQWDNAFVTNWKTDAANGYTDNNNIRIPLRIFADRVVINWGDGEWEDSNYEQYVEHEYKEPGVYSVSVAGENITFAFREDSGDNSKLMAITNWGDLKLGNYSHAFYNAVNMVITADDIPDLSNCTTMENIFTNCKSLTDIPRISEWDVSKVGQFNSLFRDCEKFNADISGWNTQSAWEMKSVLMNCKSFDQDISSWNISKVIRFTDFLKGATLSTENYDKLLKGWSEANPPYDIAFHAGNSKYSSASAAARQALIDNDKWTITDGGLE